MRCCYYVSKRRISLSGYLSILPHLAIPIGFQSHSTEPLTKNDEQSTTSTIHNWEDYQSASKPYNASSSEHESLRCSGTLLTLNIDGATNSSHPQEDLGLLAVNDDWLSEEILLNCNSEGEPDISLLLHISDDAPEASNVELTDDVLQEPFTSSDQQLAVTSELHKEGDCASNSKPHDVPQSSNTMLQGTSIPSMSDKFGATGNSHSHETPDSQGPSAADDKWLPCEISQTLISHSDSEVSYLFHLVDKLQEECGQQLEDQKLQRSVATHESFENVKCMIPCNATSEPANNAQSLHESQASQLTSEKDFLEGSPSQPGSLQISNVEKSREILRTTLKTWRDNITQMKRALSGEMMTIEDSQLHRVPTSDHEASDQGRQSSAQLTSTTSSTTSLSPRNVHPSEKQHRNLEPGISDNSLNDCGGSSRRITQVNILSHSRLLRKSLNDSFSSKAPAEVGRDSMESQKCLSASKRTKKRLMGPASTRKKRGSLAQYEITGRGLKRAGDDLNESSPISRSRIDGPIRIKIRKMYPDHTVAQLSNFKQKAAAADVSPNAEAVDRDISQGNTPLASFDRVTKALASTTPQRYSTEWLQSVIQQPQHSEFAAKVKKLAKVWSTNWNTLQGKYLYRRNRFWPILRRISLWLRAIVTCIDSQQVSDDDDINTPSNSKSEQKSRILRITTGRHSRHATMDGAYALTLYHLIGEDKEGRSFVNTLLVPSDSEPSRIQQAWKEVLCFICQQLPSDILPLLADLEPFVFCSLIYAIVTENVDITGDELFPEKVGSKDFVSFIVSHTKEFLRGGADLRMSQKQLEDMKTKCPWVSIVPSHMDQFIALDGDEQESITDRMVFDLQKVACLFKSIEAVSTTVSPNGKFHAQNARKIILTSQERQVKEWLQELPNLLALSKSVQTTNCGNWYHVKAQENDLLVILRRFQAWLGGIINRKAGRVFNLNCSPRIKLREFMDGLGLFARFLTFPKYVEIFEELLILVSNLLRACKTLDIKIDQISKPYNFNDFMEAVSKSRKAQELLLCSTLYSILWKNLNFGEEDYFNYNVLEEEDLTAICDQAKKYLESLVGSTEADIKLPEVDRARINERLRRRA